MINHCQQNTTVLSSSVVSHQTEASKLNSIMILCRFWPYFSENISRSYLSVSLLRKYIFTALVIILGQQDGPDAVILLLILQLWYLVYLCLVRPFRNNIDNIIEICLESIYFIILNLILIDVQSSKWLNWEKALPSILLTLCICKCFYTKQYSWPTYKTTIFQFSNSSSKTSNHLKPSKNLNYDNL